MSIILDIETSAFDFEELAESQQEFLFRYAEKDENGLISDQKRQEIIRYLNLYPFTAKIIVIGLLNTETDHSMVLYEGEGEDNNINDKNVIYKPLTEIEMIQYFWEVVTKVKRIITFNGRLFDIPFLMMRSALNKIKPSRNFNGNRFKHDCHLDLLEEFTFHGMTKKFNLDFYCRSFGIESPKSKGVTGMDIQQLYNAGRVDEIACYCHEDILATYQLFKIWDEYLNL